MAPPPSADSGMRRHFRIFIKQRKDKVMNDMEKCFYEPAELSVVDEGKGRSLVREKGSPYKLGFSLWHKPLTAFSKALVMRTQ